MPWSPIPKFPEIMENIKNLGYEKEVPRNIIENEIARVTGVIREHTQAEAIKWMCRLGWLKAKNNNVFVILKKK